MGNCDFIKECPLGVRCKMPMLAEYTNPKVEVLIVKSIPSKDCDNGNNLFGESSDRLTLLPSLVKSKLMDNRTKIGFTSLVRCGLDKNDKELSSAKNKRTVISLCSENMYQSLARLPNLKIIIPLGSEARDFFCEDKLTITKSVGMTYRRDFGFGNVIILPNFSAAAVNYSPDMYEAKFLEVFIKAYKAISGGASPNAIKFNTRYLSYLEFVEYAERLKDYYKSGRIKDISFDIETSSVFTNSKDSSVVDLKESEEYITGFSIADEVELTGYYINLYHPRLAEVRGEDQSRWEEGKVKKILVELLEMIPFYCHNAKYDISWCFEKLKIDLRKVVLIDDTLLMAYLLIGVKRDTGISLSLKSLSKMYFDIEEDWDESRDIEFAKFSKIKDRRLINIDFKVLCQYAGMDVIVMLYLREYFKREFAKPENSNMGWSYQLLLEATKTFVDIESRGVVINEPLLSYLEELYVKRVSDAHAKFNLAPQTQKFYQKKMREKYPEADEEDIRDKASKYDMTVRGNLVKEYVFDFLKCDSLETTPTGLPSFNVDAKENIVKNAKFEYQKEIVSYIREELEIQSQISKYLNVLRNHYEKYGKYFPSYNLAAVATGRISGDFHMLPSFGDIKFCFVSEWAVEGGVIMAPDYSQVEVRVFASLSQDEHLRQAYKDGLDIHKFVASQSFGVTYEEVSKLQRSNAKAVIFGMLYGQSVYTLSEILGGSVEEAQAVQDSIFKRFPKVKKWIDKTVAMGERDGYVDSATGRRRYLSSLKKYKYSKDKRERSLYNSAVRAAMNSPIQSSASDITLSSIISIHKYLIDNEFYSHFMGTVHDSLEFSVHPSEIIKMIFLIKYKCEDELESRFNWLNDVPYRIDIDMGMSWGSCVGVEILSHNDSKTQVELEISGRDIGVQRLNTLFARNAYISVEVLEEESVEEEWEVDKTRAFNGVIHLTSTHRIKQKIRLTQIP